MSGSQERKKPKKEQIMVEKCPKFSGDIDLPIQEGERISIRITPRNAQEDMS